MLNATQEKATLDMLRRRMPGMEIVLETLADCVRCILQREVGETPNDSAIISVVVLERLKYFLEVL